MERVEGYQKCSRQYRWYTVPVPVEDQINSNLCVYVCVCACVRACVWGVTPCWLFLNKLRREFDEKSKITSKKNDDDIMSTNYDVIVIFPSNDQFGAFRQLYSGCLACNTYIFIKSNLLSYKN